MSDKIIPRYLSAHLRTLKGRRCFWLDLGAETRVRRYSGPNKSVLLTDGKNRAWFSVESLFGCSMYVGLRFYLQLANEALEPHTIARVRSIEHEGTNLLIAEIEPIDDNQE